ncbi:hypothetical protein MTO96_018126 [Rhipicephalus appendiculatus]
MAKLRPRSGSETQMNVCTALEAAQNACTADATTVALAQRAWVTAGHDHKALCEDSPAVEWRRFINEVAAVHDDVAWVSRGHLKVVTALVKRKSHVSGVHVCSVLRGGGGGRRALRCELGVAGREAKERTSVVISVFTTPYFKRESQRDLGCVCGHLAKVATSICGTLQLEDLLQTST